MSSIRRALDRHHDRRRKHEVWQTFPSQEASADRFGTIEALNEVRLEPGAVIPRHAHRDIEIITYVREGAIAYEDSMGCSGVIHAGEFQRLTAGRGIRNSETNASFTECAHVFQIWLSPSGVGLEPSYEQKRFSVAERRGRLCAVASPNARRGSLRVHQDALLHSAILYPGQHLVHELPQGRSVWLHLVQGEVTLGDSVLTTGDGAGITTAHAVSLTARQETEILLLDMGEQAGIA